MKPLRRIAGGIALLCAIAGLPASSARADVTTRTPVMGPSLMSAKQLADWYNRHKGSNQPQLPSLHNNVQALAQIFIDEGKAEGVRGDIAFVQSMLETGWLSFRGSQIIPAANNYAGIYAFDKRGPITSCADEANAERVYHVPSRCFATPQLGALVQIQLLRSYADPSTKTMTGRLISAPSDRVGAAPLWEYFGGTNCPCGKLIWASASDYGLIIIRMYSGALAESGLAGACVPYAPAPSGSTSGNGYWEVAADGSVTPFGSAHSLGDLRGKRLSAPVFGGESTSDNGGYWLLGRDGGIFTFGDANFYGSTGAMRLTKPVNGMERTSDSHGYWLVADDGGVFTFGNAKFYGSMGGKRLNQPVVGMERTASGKGYWEFASDGGLFTFGDAKFFGSLGSTRLKAPVVSMQRTASGNGYWMLTADGHVYKFGDAVSYGDLGGCGGFGFAARLLVTPSGHGYWVATFSGAIIRFGDAKNLGFPATSHSITVGLLGAG